MSQSFAVFVGGRSGGTISPSSTLGSAAVMTRKKQQDTKLPDPESLHSCSSKHSEEAPPAINARMMPPLMETLPPELWARILEYSVFSDIIRLVKQTDYIKDTVLPLVRFVYFDKQMECSWLDARRTYSFDRVEEIVIDCLICNVLKNETFEVQGLFRVMGLIDFLSGLDKLRHILIGKGENETRAQILDRLWLAGNSTIGYTYKVPKFVDTCHPYSPCDESAAGLYQAILNQFSHGYQQGMLSNTLHVHGLPSHHAIINQLRLVDFQFIQEDRCQGKECITCRLVCQHFPLDQVVSLKRSVKWYFPCKVGAVPLDTRLEWISERENGKDVLVAKQVEFWRDLLGHYDMELLDDGVGGTHDVITFEESVLRAMSKLKEYGCDPSCTCLRDIDPFRRTHKIKRTTYMRLFELGFKVNENDFVAVVSDTLTR